MLSMPTAKATSRSIAITARDTGRRGMGSAFEEDHDRAAAAVHRVRLDEREDVVAAREQPAHALLEDRLAADPAPALAMDDAHAAQPPPPRGAHECGGP